MYWDSRFNLIIGGMCLIGFLLALDKGWMLWILILGVMFSLNILVGWKYTKDITEVK